MSAKNKKILSRLLLSIYTLLFLAIIFVVAFQFNYAHKIYPQIMVNNIDLSGQEKASAIEYLTAQTDRFLSKGLTFAFQDYQTNISPVITDAQGSDIFAEVYSYDITQTINQAYNYGHLGNLSTRFKQQIDSLFNKKQIPIKLNIDKVELENILRQNFLELDKPATDASLNIAVDENVASVSINNEVIGQTFDYEKAILEAQESLLNFEQKIILLDNKIDEPKITKEAILPFVSQIEEAIALSPIIFKYEDKTWELTDTELSSWIELDANDQDIILNIKKEEAENFLAIIARIVRIEEKDAEFEIIDGRVTLFKPSEDGLALNIDKTITRVLEKLFTEKSNQIDLAVEVVKAKLQTKDVNDLGIIELIGRGVSDFSGSPVNRIHNIEVGAKALNGLIIKPGETFSALKALGDIDGSNGYKKELVIKGNKIIPEYGGGLCQISTTIFRAAIQSGLPIVERRSHSYNIGYYAPTGSDATIYDPAPDMRWLNDTGNNILFIARSEGGKLIFEYWGTKDGREVKFIGNEATDDVTKLVPIVFNVVQPGPPRYVETDTLAPGETKKQESGYTGAHATFDYIVTYPDGRVEEETFKSHYRPKQAVYLIGKEKIESEVLVE